MTAVKAINIQSLGAEARSALIVVGILKKNRALRRRLSCWTLAATGKCYSTAEQFQASEVSLSKQEATMGFGRGLLLWLLGIPIPVIILLAIFWHH
jgi:hypothetical protein